MTREYKAFDNSIHTPVLPEELLSFIPKKENLHIMDGTLGLAGHAELVLTNRGKVSFVGVDADEKAIELAKERLQKNCGEQSLLFIHSNYSEIEAWSRRYNLPKFDVIYFDLGVSSMQLDEAERGFSFTKDGPLDMRMDATLEKTAATVVNNYPEKELMRIFTDYGEERFSKKIAKAIVNRRKEEAFTRTIELADFIKRQKHYKKKSRIHPATLCFQAIRIEVNNELENLKTAINSAINLLNPGGKLLVITFHSLEDRIVKQEMKTASIQCICQPEAPICVCNHEKTLKLLSKKPIIPTEEEVKTNVRSRSAKLRAGERI